LPAFGIHHQSRTNPFNLVDDLLEPFRPLVDLRAHARQSWTPGDEVDLEDRRHMAAVLQDTLSLGAEQLTVLAATEAMAASLVRAIDGADAALLAAPALPLARRPGHAGR
jgi:CRISPR-associated protein Cas1